MSFRTMALFQISSSTLPSIIGGFSNFGIRTGWRFSGGRTGAPRRAPPVEASLVLMVELGVCVGVAEGDGSGINRSRPRADTNVQATRQSNGKICFRAIKLFTQSAVY